MGTKVSKGSRMVFCEGFCDRSGWEHLGTRVECGDEHAVRSMRPFNTLSDRPTILRSASCQS